MQVTINNRVYELATTLRVAYEMQKQNNHKAYSEIFQNLGSMNLEDQIALIYCAFKVANPEAAAEVSKTDFLEYYLDHYTLKAIMDQLKEVIQGITGERVEQHDVSKTKDSRGN